MVRFNWHFFAGAILAILGLGVAGVYFPLCFVAAGLAGLSLVLSLAATAHAYDLSGLYQLDWLRRTLNESRFVVNIHSGFDETSALVKSVNPAVDLSIMDFYDPEKHTEVSIRRARRIHPPHPETIPFPTHKIPLDTNSVDLVLLTLAAHEIRDLKERITFFKEVRRILAPHGQAIVTEHLRDLPNLIAYNLGAWHFHPRQEWLQTFRGAGLQIANEEQRNLFITTFTLTPHEASD
ncbi:MAG: methyltransferase domain-containing protein [Verrucomicrobiota bacterium]